MTTLGAPKPGKQAKRAKNPPIDKAAWLQWRIDRGRDNLCECGCGRPGHILHHCIIGRKKGHPELDDFRNYALVNADEDSTRKFDNREWHKHFWYMHCLDLGSETMLEWVNSLPPKMRSRIDWL